VEAKLEAMNEKQAEYKHQQRQFEKETAERFTEVH
jgi:hypothetical protein